MFSVRFYEECGFPARPKSFGFEMAASSNASPKGASTPKELLHSVASASGSEFAKVFT